MLMFGRVSRMHLRKEDFSVEPCPLSGALDLCRRFHYSRGGPRTRVHALGLYTEGVLVGATIWLPPLITAARWALPSDPHSVLCLSRTVIDPDQPTNAASFLVGRSIRHIRKSDPRWLRLLTYADPLEGHTGAIYKATNWTERSLGSKSDRWVDASGKMVSRYCAGPLSVADMKARGCTRIKGERKRRFTFDLRKGLEDPRN